jgi:hypothetical protein
MESQAGGTYDSTDELTPESCNCFEITDQREDRMKIRQGCIVLMFLLLAAPAMAAEEIYTWIGDDGARRFSNVGAPEGATDYEVITARPRPDAQAEGVRDGYVEMMQEVREDLRASDMQRQLLAAARLEYMRMRSEADAQARIGLECARLQREIDALTRRGYSRYWTKGMRDHQIRRIEDQLHSLRYCR